MKTLLAVLFVLALIARVSAAPVNDAFSGRLPILSDSSGTRSSVSGNLATATVETGEPNHAERVCTRSVWWTWTASANGTLEVSTEGSANPATLAIYTGTQLSSLRPVAHSREGGPSNSSLIRITVQSGTPYQIAVADVAGVGEAVRLRLRHLAKDALANDNFSNSIPLTGALATAAGSNVGARKESGEPVHAGNAGGKSLWWSWTAPADGTVTVSTRDSTAAENRALDTTLGIYTGAQVSGLTLVAANNNASNLVAYSEASFYARQGVSYHIAVDGFRDPVSGTAEGTIALRISLVRANDKFGTRILLTTSSALVEGITNTHATKDAGEPNHAENIGGKSLWWSWTAPANGTVTLATTGSNFDTLLGVYTGTAVNDLDLVAQNDDHITPANPTNKTSRVEFHVVAKQRYHIAVDGKNATTAPASAASGSITLDLDFTSDAPAIATQPTNQSVIVGDTATFTLVATGKAPLVYIWQRRLAGSSTWTPLPSQSLPALELPPVLQSANGDTFRCIVSNEVGTADPSAIVTLHVTPPPPVIVLPAILRVRGAVSIASAPAGAPAGLKYYASPLPPGLTINPDTGLITGTVTKPGTYSVTYWSQAGKVKSPIKSISFNILPVPTPMIGSFEGLLLANDVAALPAGKLTLTVAPSGALTGTLFASDLKSFALTGALTLNPEFTVGTATITLKRAPLANYTLALEISAPATPPSAPTVLTARLSELAVLKASLADGVKLPVLTAASGVGAYTATIQSVPLAGGDTRDRPLGAGYATATITAAGILKLTGKLSDGTKLTASLARDSAAGYRLYAKPYAATVGGALAGRLPLTPRADNPALHRLVTEDVYWTKPANPKDKLYPAGFGTLGVTLAIERWIKPAGSLGATLRLPLDGANHAFAVNISGAGISNDDSNSRGLPVRLLLTSKNLVAVPLPNSSAWSTKITLGTGAFTASFTVLDPNPLTSKTVKRVIRIEGVLQQLPVGSPSPVFARGFFLAPPVVKGGPTLSGDIRFAPPSP